MGSDGLVSVAVERGIEMGGVLRAFWRGSPDLHRGALLLWPIGFRCVVVWVGPIGLTFATLWAITESRII